MSRPTEAQRKWIEVVSGAARRDTMPGEGRSGSPGGRGGPNEPPGDGRGGGDDDQGSGPGRRETVDDFVKRGGRIQRGPAERAPRDISAKPTQDASQVKQQAERGGIKGRDPIIEDPNVNSDRLRQLPGRAAGGERLAVVNGNWFGETPGRIAPIPGQIAQRMRAIGDFRNFAEFRQTFWQLVAEDARLAPPNGWSPANLTLMRSGLPPRVIGSQATGGRANAVLQLNHRHALEHGGDVYDLDNLEVVTPVMHGGMRM